MFNELTNFVLGAGLNLAVALIIVRFIYYPLTQNKNYVFTFLAFSTIVYFVLGLFTSTDLSVGVGFGLFAIFSVLRYRTDEMPIREMTYLFIIIALPVMNSILMSNGDVMKLLAANGMIVGLLYILEKEWGFHFESSKKITYEKIDLITPANRDYLLADLRQRTGLPIKRVEIGRLNFLRDTAELKIFYDEPQPARSAIRPQIESKNSQQHQETILKL
jgi:multisubunit Na+/H+ antiporter MnhE subunit